MAIKAKAEATIFDQTDATAIRSWYHAQTSTTTPSAPTTTTASDTPSGWTLAEPTISGASDLSKYVYRCEQLVWGDGTCDWGTVTLSTSYEAAKVAYNEAQSAKTTATRYITGLTDGIMVHPDGDDTTGWSIRDALEMLKSGVSVFRVWLENNAPKVRIGKSDSFHAIVDTSGMTIQNGANKVLSFTRSSSNSNLAQIGFGDDPFDSYITANNSDVSGQTPTASIEIRASHQNAFASSYIALVAARNSGADEVDGSLEVNPDESSITTDFRVFKDLFVNGSITGSLAATNLTGTIDSARLPTVPRNKGGTGTTGRTDSAVTRSGVSTAGNFYAYNNGVGVTIGADSLRLKTALANGANVALGTAPTGCRPPRDMYTYIATSNATFAGKCMVRIVSNGTITLYNASGSSLATSVNINFTITFVI